MFRPCVIHFFRGPLWIGLDFVELSRELKTDLPSRAEDHLKRIRMLGTMEEHLRAAVRTARKALSVLKEVRRIERKQDVKARARDQSFGRSTCSNRRRSNDGEN
ncbi:hypothetical protein DPMN_011999 [Dreissena polymorpha]|uniref:Uncharacterized protein n=1 Tax=Dreissena polymorpha TaxID=45954 RepID=A0A9D4N1K6_DREPO|nr:hypothetical protein DPMN_011999 [Dreissena polymorpha]